MKEPLYNQSEAVAALNHVEGFEPMKCARIIQNEGQEDQLYLDVKYRKLWFRLAHPLGKIVSRIINFAENMAIVEARIYLDKNDPEDQYISNSYAQKYRSEDPKFGDKFLEVAETAAVGRALADAGFGVQFADVGEENDPNQVDAGIPVSNAMPQLEMPNMQGVSIPQQPGNGGTMPFQGQPVNGGMPASNNYYQQSSVPPQQMPNAMQPQWSNAPQAQKAPAPLDASLPVEELVRRMSYEQATKVVIPTGKYKGKTMGQIAIDSPGSVQWYASSYTGANHLLPAAARKIMEQAMPMAG